ncbi:MAG: hypothetical protein ABI763_09345 [Bacteroidota bacterium]
MRRKYIFFILLTALWIAVSCEKTPNNPYGDVNYDTDTTTSQSADPNSIVGLHRNIFFPRCAKSTCHDGTFEPDYRTVMSTYSTLVYQPVNKTHCNDDTSRYFSLRVIPYDGDNSFLMERLRTQTADYMPSNGNGGRLSPADTAHIYNWIMNGAKDQNGNIPVAPNLPPVISSIFAMDADSFTNFVFYQVDNIRLGGISYNPFIIHPNQNIYIVFGATDDSTSYADLSLNQLKLSYSMDDFSNSTTVNASYNAFAQLWLIPINANNYTPNDTVFFRYYVNDGDHVQPTEFPRDDYSFYYKYYCSFIVQ